MVLLFLVLSISQMYDKVTIMRAQNLATLRWCSHVVPCGL